jgi:hypothetical protein
MGRFAINRERLQERLLAELRKFPGCDGAESVVVRRLADRKAFRNWEILVFDSGSSESGRCKEALARIYARAADEFELVGD